MFYHFIIIYYSSQGALNSPCVNDIITVKHLLVI